MGVGWKFVCAGAAAVAMVCCSGVAGAHAVPLVSAVPAGVHDSRSVLPSQAAPAGMRAPSWAKVERKTAKALRVWWAKVPGASGYVVYRQNTKSKKYVAVKTLVGGSKTQWVDKKRKTGTTYTYRVAAYREVGGEKTVGSLSYWVSAVPYKKNAKVVNAGKIMAEDVTLGLFMTTRYHSDGVYCAYCGPVAVQPSELSKAKDKRPVNWRVRVFLVSGSDVVRVGGDGRVFPLKAGRARLRLVAHNGSRRTVTVTVKDLSHPKFPYQEYPVGSAERILLGDRGAQVGEVGRLATQWVLKGAPVGARVFSFDDSGVLVCVADGRPCSDPATPPALVKAMDALLTDFVYPMVIEVEVQKTRTGTILVLTFSYWLTPDKSDEGGVLAYDPAPSVLIFPSPTYVAPGWTIGVARL